MLSVRPVTPESMKKQTGSLGGQPRDLAYARKLLDLVTKVNNELRIGSKDAKNVIQTTLILFREKYPEERLLSEIDNKLSELEKSIASSIGIRGTRRSLTIATMTEIDRLYSERVEEL